LYFKFYRQNLGILLIVLIFINN